MPSGADLMSDSSRMPFGKYEGRRMENVPAEYLDWIIDQPWISKWPGLKAYIESSRDAITAELEEKSNDA